MLLQRSIGSPRRRRLSLPLGLRVFVLNSPGPVSVFLVVSRSSSVARAAGPSVACGSRSLSGRRARSHSVVVGCGRALAAAAGAAAARRSRGRPFRRCGSSTAFFVCVLLRDFVPRCGRFVGAVCVAQLTTPSSALSWSPVSRGDSEISLPAIKQGY